MVSPLIYTWTTHTNCERHTHSQALTLAMLTLTQTVDEARALTCIFKAESFTRFFWTFVPTLKDIIRTPTCPSVKGTCPGNSFLPSL